MWELVHMLDVSLESDVARVRNPPRPFRRGMCFSSGEREGLAGGGVDYVLLFFLCLV